MADPRTFRNDRSGQTVTTTLTNAEAAAAFAEHYKDDHWLWYWLHTYAMRQQQYAGNGSGVALGKGLNLIADMFIVALGYGLKRPMIRLHYRNQRFKIYLSRRGTLCLKAGMLVMEPSPLDGRLVPTNKPEGDEFYVGCFRNNDFLPARYGQWDPDRNGYATNFHATVRTLLPAEAEFIASIASHPVAFLAECSKDMDRCCYCNQQLEDKRSKLAGYGATCAKRWGLPWGDKDRTEKAPSFASCYNDDAAGLCKLLREKPRDEHQWLVFSDWLEEHGLPPCKMPESRVIIPTGV